MVDLVGPPRVGDGLLPHMPYLDLGSLCGQPCPQECVNGQLHTAGQQELRGKGMGGRLHGGWDSSWARDPNAFGTGLEVPKGKGRGRCLAKSAWHRSQEVMLVGPAPCSHPASRAPEQEP